jgi:hypothetical protein
VRGDDHFEGWAWAAVLVSGDATPHSSVVSVALRVSLDLVEQGAAWMVGRAARDVGVC